jgi:hypothetical protein
MIGMACLAAFVISWLVGAAIVRAVLGDDWRPTPPTLRLGLAWAAGAAFSGMTTFWVTVLAPDHRGTVVAVLSAVALGLGLLRSTRWPDEPATRVEPEMRGQRIVRRIGAVAFAAVLVVWLAHGLDIAVDIPAGGFDAFSIWTQRARFFYLAPGEWTRAFDPAMEWSHPEYPGLLPGLIAYGWLPEGRCVALSPAAVALLTQAARLLLIVGFTRAAYPRSVWPWAFGIFFATIPEEWAQAEAWQYADRPLSMFLLAGVGCLAMATSRGTRRPWLFLAGLFCGAAGFCKDEGKAALVLLAVGAAVATIGSLVRGGGRRAIGDVGWLALGLVPGVASLRLQYAYNPTTTKLIELMTLGPLTDAGRTAVIASYLRGRLEHPASGGLWWICALALATLWPWLRRRDLGLLWAFPAAQLLVYLVIFQLTPHPLQWHLESALPRLLFHVGPIAYLAACWLILEALRAMHERSVGSPR